MGKYIQHKTLKYIKHFNSAELKKYKKYAK